MTGIIKTYLSEKGYGFIRSDVDQREYFFHHSCCVTPFAELDNGKKVMFEVVSSPKGPRAEEVRLL
jgi:CspA family cold shock protein